MKGFRKIGRGKENTQIDDLGEYVRAYISEHSDVTIYVGTDSEKYSRHISYATVVLFYHERNGAHYIYRSDKIPKPNKRDVGLSEKEMTWDAIRDMYPKLWGEVERTFEVAEYLEKELDGVYPRAVSDQKLVDIDIDMNPSKKWMSNMLYDASLGYFIGHGYRVKGKPRSWASSIAADSIVKNKKRKRR